MSGFTSAMGLSAAGTGTTAAGDIMGGIAASKADKFNEQVALQNAALAKQNAALEGGIGEANYGMAGLKTAQEVGGIKDAQSGRGVDVNSGSAKMVQQSQSEMGMLNQANIRSNAARAAYGFEVQAVGDENQAALDKAKASNDMAGAIGQAGAALFKGGGNLATYGDGPTGGDSSGIIQDVSQPITIDNNQVALGQIDNDSSQAGLMSGDPSVTQINNALFNSGSTR